MKIRALIIDDEPPARERLRTLVQSHKEVEVIGECSNGREAVETIESTTPDLVFLDIQMPEMDGFEVLAALDCHRLPLVIFVTAYDQFALRAFEVHAVDYLLKPFDKQRFEEALGRAIERLKTAQPEKLTAQLSALLADLGPASTRNDRLPIKSGGKVLLVPIDDIDWIEAADNYVTVHVSGKSHLHRETLTSLHARLGLKFVRINRSAVVNSNKIKELEPMFHGDYSLLLENGTRLAVSRNFKDALKPLLGGN